MTVTKFLWDDDTDTVVMEKDGSGTVTAEYTTAPRQYGRLLSQHRDGTTSHFHFDGNGNTRALTDASQTVTDRYSYTAFGDQVATTGTTPNRYRFGGQYGYQYNDKTQDYYVRERVYEPKRGMWNSADPLRFVDAISQYVYANNEPLAAADPSGKLSQETDVQTVTIIIQGAGVLHNRFVPIRVGHCGMYGWKTRWILDDAREKADGVIMQEVTRVSRVTPCPGAALKWNDPPTKCKNKVKHCPFNSYLELWTVKRGQRDDKFPLSDIFSLFGTKHTCKGGSVTAGARGDITQTGEAQFLSGDSDAIEKVKAFFKTGEHGVTSACDLPSACVTRPLTKRLNGLIKKYKLRKTKKTKKKVVRSWKCCACPCPDAGTLKCSIDGKEEQACSAMDKAGKG